MKYVDGFVVAVPADKKDAYREMAAKAAPLFKEFGALRIVECWASDVPDGKVTDFRMAVKAEENEVTEVATCPLPCVKYSCIAAIVMLSFDIAWAKSPSSSFNGGSSSFSYGSRKTTS